MKKIKTILEEKRWTRRAFASVRSCKIWVRVIIILVTGEKQSPILLCRLRTILCRLRTKLTASLYWDFSRQNKTQLCSNFKLGNYEGWIKKVIILKCLHSSQNYKCAFFHIILILQLCIKSSNLNKFVFQLPLEPI